MTQVPRAESGVLCPLWKKDVSKVCHACSWYIHVRGVDNNTGADVDNWGCSIGFLPMLLIENAAQTRGAAAATEDARNQIVDAFERVASAGANAKLIGNR